MSLSSSMRNEHQTDGDYRTSANGEARQGEIIPSSLLRIGDRAAGPMFMRDFDQRRNGARTLGYAESAARLESAARRHGMQGWDGACDRPQQTPALGLQVRHGVQESAGVRVRRSEKYLAPLPEFHKTSGIHHRHAVGNLRDHGEIMRDEQHGQSKFGAQLREKIENLRLDGDVERGGGLVGAQQLL